MSIISETLSFPRAGAMGRVRSDQDDGAQVAMRFDPANAFAATALAAIRSQPRDLAAGPALSLGVGGQFTADRFDLPLRYAASDRLNGDPATGRLPDAAASAAATRSPKDDLYGSQWYLGLLGGIEKVWADYTGSGVKVGVYDSGVQYSHYDLDDNYDASLHITVDGVTYDGDYRPASGPHGTSVAGIIAAERNGVGAVGVAYHASLTGVNIFDPFSGGGLDPGIFVNADDLARFFVAVEKSAAFDVVNHSWGGNPLFVPDNGRAEGTFADRLHDAITLAAETGRDGLGTIQVKAAGNHSLDTQGEGSNLDRHFIIVGAYREVDGSSSYYSGRGGGLLISAPSNDYAVLGGTGVVTTDLLGRDGYNLALDPGGDFDYTDSFGGTSAATPVVTGVVALMLDANADLGWRDVREILASSATLPVPFETGQTFVDYFGPVILNEGRFALNGDTNWNGGGKHFSPDYGYGAVNAFNAVRMAEVWSLFGEAKTSANEVAYSTPVYDINVEVPSPARRDIWTEENYQSDFDGTPVSFTFEVGQDVRIEHLDFVMTYDFGYKPTKDFPIRQQGNLDGWKIRLTSPDGTQVFVDTGVYLERSSTFDGTEQTWTFGFAGFIGEGSAGTWTVEVEDPFAYDLGYVRTVQAQFYGSAVESDDVYHYTDEFFTMAAIDGEDGRTLLTDRSGVDWVDAAALTADVVLDLRPGRTTRFDGVDAFTLAPGSVIENGVTGDGDDRLNGNRADNALHGMRGNDVLRGFGGDDHLVGGADRDRLVGAKGADVLEGGDGRDTLKGGAGGDVFMFDGGTDAGRDRIVDFGAGDLFVTTVGLADRNGNGIIHANGRGIFELAGGGAVSITGDDGKILPRLEFDGIFEQGDTRYYVYSQVGSSADVGQAVPAFDLVG